MTSTTTAFLAVSQNLSRYQTMTAAEPAVKTASAYYAANIGSVKSISDLVGNYRLLVLRAQRLWPRRPDQREGAHHQGAGRRGFQSEEPREHSAELAMEGVRRRVQLRRQRRNSAFIDQRGRDDNERLCRTAAGERSGRPGRGRPACALFPARRADGHQRIRNFGRSQSSAGGGDDHGAPAGGGEPICSRRRSPSSCPSPT